MGQEAVFAKPILACISLIDQSSFTRTPEQWIEVITTRTYLSRKQVGNQLRFSPPPMPEMYDATKTEEELRSNLEYIPAPQKAASGITGSLFIYHGVLIPAPYDIEHYVTDDGAHEVRVNGITLARFREKSQAPSSTEVLKNFKNLPEDHEFTNVTDIVWYLTYVKYPEWLKSLGKDGAIRKTVAFLESQSNVISSTQVTDTMVYLSSVKFPTVRTEAFVAGTNTDTGIAPQPMDTVASNPEEKADKKLEQWRKDLSKSRVIIQTKGVNISFNLGETSKKFGNTIAIASNQPLPIAESLINEVVKSRMAAREIAVRLNETAPWIVAEIDKLMAQR